jgi:hypothetical protein
LTAKLKDVALRWLRDVLGLPPETGVGFFTGATMAISAAYLPASPTRDPSNFTPELSRRALRVVREVTEDPEQRLLDMAEAYRNFAMSNPELYQVMNDLGVCLLVASKKPPAARESFDITQEALVDWAKVKGVDIPDVGGRGGDYSQPRSRADLADNGGSHLWGRTTGKRVVTTRHARYVRRVECRAIRVIFSFLLFTERSSIFKRHSI